METKFTKGEWHAEDSVTGAVWSAPKQNGIVKPKDILIASVYPHEEKDIQEREANMKLIAAAPDLLEALEYMIDSFWGNYKEEGFRKQFRLDYPNHIINNAEAAIKKATE